ncbi:MAG: protein kinase, partial [Myxococcota bacterium]|nr:protein kinase [Myxococcota bacterium]
VLHRDLKPENIMVGDRPNMRDHVKVVDFGIAKVTDAGQSLASVQSIGGLFCGTPEYMSPEQSRGGEIDGRSDLYSLGVILYQLLVGHVPFQDSTPLGVITRHLSEAPVPPEEILSDVSRELSALALRLLSKEPEQRFGTAMDVVSELDYIQGLLLQMSSPHSTTEREAATLSDIPVCDTTQETRPQPLQQPTAGQETRPQPLQQPTADQETRPQLVQIPSDATTQPALMEETDGTSGDTDRALAVAGNGGHDSEHDPERETSPGDELTTATRDVPSASFPRTTPMRPVGLGQGELARTWLTGLLLALAVFMIGWLVFNVWPTVSPANEPDQTSVRETPP